MTRLKAVLQSILGVALGLAALGLFASLGLAVLGGLLVAALALGIAGRASGSVPRRIHRSA